MPEWLGFIIQAPVILVIAMAVAIIEGAALQLMLQLLLNPGGVAAEKGGVKQRAVHETAAASNGTKFGCLQSCKRQFAQKNTFQIQIYAHQVVFYANSNRMGSTGNSNFSGMREWRLLDINCCVQAKDVQLFQNKYGDK